MITHQTPIIYIAQEKRECSRLKPSTDRIVSDNPP